MRTATRNIESLKATEEGIWADLEAGDAPAYLPGHAVRLFRENLLTELASIVSAKDFMDCLERASDALPRPTPCAGGRQ